MKRFFDLPYRIKLLITHLGVVLVVVAVITTMVTFRANTQLRESGTTNLFLLTEQLLINYTNEVESAERYVYTMAVNSGTARTMREMAGQTGARNELLIDLMFNLSNMVDRRAPYDHVVVRTLDGTMVSNRAFSANAVESGEEILSRPENINKSYGEITWLRTEDGEVYLVRDVYDTQPLRYVGKMCVRMQQDELVSISEYNEHQNYTVLFFDDQGDMIVSVGTEAAFLAPAAKQLLSKSGSMSVQVDGNAFAACVLRQGEWTAVGFMPMSIMETLERSVFQSGVLAAALGVLLGLSIAIALSRQLSSRISVLVDSMHRVEAGDLDVTVPLQGKDEIDVLTGQFNRMTAKTKELLQKVVQEENSKRQAEFMNLEYEYRFLQWQVNPHFIYNALETINALAKIDGNDELSDMIVLLSDYFRKNAEAIRKKFVTVSQEFRSLSQYAEIYRSIYGDALSVEFDIAPDAEEALLPTMIIQPLLENALVHGTGSAAGTTILALARADGDSLLVTISDNGAGMTKETIDKLMSTREEAASGGRTSLGVRNVLDRMHLLYGDAGSMSIRSELGQGTSVSVRLPLSYEEKTAFRAEKQ